MSIPKKRPSGPKRKKIFADAFQANKHITITALSFLTGDSNKTIENALYAAGRWPSMWHLYVIERMIRQTGGTLPVSLARVVNRYKARWRRWCMKNMLPRRSIERTGKLIASPPRKYTFRGELMTTGEISRRTGVDVSAISSFLRRNIEAGGDATAAIDHKIKTGRFSKKHT